MGQPSKKIKRILQVFSRLVKSIWKLQLIMKTNSEKIMIKNYHRNIIFCKPEVLLVQALQREIKAD
jgi:hypothetical protein